MASHCTSPVAKNANTWLLPPTLRPREATVSHKSSLRLTGCGFLQAARLELALYNLATACPPTAVRLRSELQSQTRFHLTDRTAADGLIPPIAGEIVRPGVVLVADLRIGLLWVQVPVLRILARPGHHRFGEACAHVRPAISLCDGLATIAGNEGPPLWYLARVTLRAKDNTLLLSITIEAPFHVGAPLF